MENRIELDPRVFGGTPVIKGTRIPVTVLLDHLANGESWDVILQGYPELGREDIKAAILFAKATLEQTDIVPLRAR